MSRKKWIIIIVVIAVLAIGHPLFLSAFTWGANPMTVSEVKARAESAGGERLRVEGTVATGSTSWDEATRTTRFGLTDGRETLNVTYKGPVPDSFRPGNDLTIEGRYADGVFEASDLDSSRPICTVCH